MPYKGEVRRENEAWGRGISSLKVALPQNSLRVMKPENETLSHLLQKYNIRNHP